MDATERARVRDSRLSYALDGTPYNAPPVSLPIADLSGLDEILLSRVQAAMTVRGVDMTDEPAVTEVLSQVLDDLTGDERNRIVSAVWGDRQRILREHLGSVSGFEGRLRETWGEAIDRLELLRLAAMDAGRRFNDIHGAAAQEEHDPVYVALLRLHGLACEVCSEVVSLLRVGHARGAFARWRTLHETAVVAFLLLEHGAALAQRYLDHDAVERYTALTHYERHAEALHLPPAPTADLERMKEARDRAIADHGDAFGAPYGWAAIIVPRGRITLAELERQANLGHWRPYYGAASTGIHPASPQSITAHLGAAGTSIMVTGPSNYGLSHAGERRSRQPSARDRRTPLIEGRGNRDGYDSSH